jgi:Na+/H+-dicarboxylate symporter
MPSMIDMLSRDLRFPRDRVELLVPLSISLLRIGPVLYYVCATMFIAQLYGTKLGLTELALVGAASILAGCASSGMTGLVTVSLAGMVCGYVGLPFEAAFVLFLAVDPVCDMLRTFVLVLGNSAAVAAICPTPEIEAATPTADASASERMSPPELAARALAQAAQVREMA